MPLPITLGSLGEWFLWSLVVSLAWYIGQWIVARTLGRIP